MSIQMVTVISVLANVLLSGMGTFSAVLTICRRNPQYTRLPATIRFAQMDLRPVPRRHLYLLQSSLKLLIRAALTQNI